MVTETGTRMDALSTARTYIRLVRLLGQQTQAETDEESLTITEMGVLGQIDRGHTLPSMIARAMALDPARVTRITDHLFALGYVQREADPEDRRRCPLRLTDQGVERLERGRLHFSTAMAGILRGLTEEELAALRVGTDGLARVLDEARAKQ
jgi:DNA-binding MarR family transcriptional regulator